MSQQMNLYRVTLRGMTDSHGISYVVAANPSLAYDKVRKDLDDRDLGFNKDKALDSIELLAADCTYPECKRRLYLAQTE